MELKVNIPFQELLAVVRQLSPTERALLQQELASKPKAVHKQKRLTQLLLDGPTLTETQVSDIEKVRKEINQWRATS